MTFSNKRPSKEGYYWYKKHPAYAPVIGNLMAYQAGSGKVGKWLVLPFGGSDIWEDHTLTGHELWGERIKQP